MVLECIYFIVFRLFRMDARPGGSLEVLFSIVC